MKEKIGKPIEDCMYYRVRAGNELTPAVLKYRDTVKAHKSAMQTLKVIDKWDHTILQKQDSTEKSHFQTKGYDKIYKLQREVVVCLEMLKIEYQADAEAELLLEDEAKRPRKIDTEEEMLKQLKDFGRNEYGF